MDDRICDFFYLPCKHFDCFCIRHYVNVSELLGEIAHLKLTLRLHLDRRNFLQELGSLGGLFPQLSSFPLQEPGAKKGSGFSGTYLPILPW